MIDARTPHINISPKKYFRPKYVRKKYAIILPIK